MISRQIRGKRLKIIGRCPERLFSTIKNGSKETWDVIVAGGGMVGNAFACACGATEFLKEKKVLILESGTPIRKPFDPTQVYSNRVSAINPSSKSLFQSLGVWDKLHSWRAKPVFQLQVWEACSQSRIHYEYPDFHSEVAHIIENDLIVNALSERIEESCPNVTVKTGSKINSCKLPEDLQNPVEIELADGSRIETQLLIGADGANSLVRKSMDVHYVTWEYGQKGIVATLKLTEKCKNDVAWQRFTPTGPIALLPLNDEMTSLVWTTSNDQAKMLMSLSEEDFTDRFTEALWEETNQNQTTNAGLFAVSKLFEMMRPNETGGVQLPPTILETVPGSRGAFPLGLGHATHYVRPRVALIGDAAHRVHPLAGQGVNLGFGDVTCLVEKLEGALKRGADLGSLQHLAEYERKQQLTNVPVMGAVDFLNRLYGNSFGPLIFLRSMGLDVVNRLGPLKKLIMNQAAG